MIHHFDIEVAKQYGVNQAILIANFQHWIAYNAANKKNYKSGKFWTYNSYSALTEIFPYFSMSQCKRIIHSLIDSGILVCEVLSANGFDKTNWYAFVDEEKWLGERLYKLNHSMGRIRPIEETNSSNPSDEIAPSITDNKQYRLKTQIKNTTKSKTRIVADEKSATANSLFNKVKDSSEEENNEIAVQSEPVVSWKAMTDTYDKWHIHHVGVSGKFNKGEGQALKDIIVYLIAQVRRKAEELEENPSNDVISEKVVQAWSFILESMKNGKVEPYLANQVKLSQIESNITNIINQIKNGNPKNKTGNSASATSEGYYDAAKTRVI